MIEKRQGNGPVKERNSKKECKADMKNSEWRLLALSLTERGGAICTKEPPASPRGKRMAFNNCRQRRDIESVHNRVENRSLWNTTNYTCLLRVDAIDKHRLFPTSEIGLEPIEDSVRDAEKLTESKQNGLVNGIKGSR